MALNPVRTTYFRPPRDYPNYHGVLGIRGFWDVGAANPGVGLKVDTPIVIGKVPGLAFINYAAVGVSVAVVGPTTPILDLGIRNPLTGVVTRAGLVAAADLTTPGIVIGAGTSRGLQLDETEIVATLGTSGAIPSAGRFNAIITFVTKLS